MPDAGSILPGKKQEAEAKKYEQKKRKVNSYYFLRIPQNACSILLNPHWLSGVKQVVNLILFSVSVLFQILFSSPAW